MPSEDTAGRRGPPHTGGRWRGTTEPAVEAAVSENCQFVVDPPADSSSASAAHEVVTSHGRTSVMNRPAEWQRSTRTAADRSGMPVDRRVWHCRNRVMTKPATRPKRAPPAWGHSRVCCGSVKEQQSSSTQSSRRVTSWRCRSPDRCPDLVRMWRGL